VRRGDTQALRARIRRRREGQGVTEVSKTSLERSRGSGLDEDGVGDNDKTECMHWKQSNPKLKPVQLFPLLTITWLRARGNPTPSEICRSTAFLLSSHISPIPRSPISEAQAFLSASGYLSIDQDGDGPSHPTRRSPRCPPDQSNRSLRLHPRIPQPHQSRRRPDHPCQAPLISWTLSLTRSAHPTRI